MRLDIKCVGRRARAVKNQNTKDCKGSFLLTLGFYSWAFRPFYVFCVRRGKSLASKICRPSTRCCRVVFQSRCESLYCISYLIHNRS